MVHTYFDHVDWFMLPFHQITFCKRFERIYNGQSRPSIHDSASFIAVVLVVIAIGSQYTGTYRQGILKGHGVIVDGLRESILTALKTDILDLLSSCSLEAAQACVLLGSYYLYQGGSSLAWPICGNALRLALALNLHREPHRSCAKDVVSRDNERRCWWAIYEIATFCCMLYGIPLECCGFGMRCHTFGPILSTPG